ncbi:MAG: cytochrome c3 family protein [Armatimonadetes bacterium]|nr:cytochrome c3 family protein [Armatimonadota bacterium]
MKFKNLVFVLAVFFAFIFSLNLVTLAVGGGNITFQAKTMGNVLFSHDKHVTLHKLACNKCHTSIFKYKKFSSGVKMDEINNGKFCGVCHNGKIAFDVKKECAKCHKK